MQRYMYSIVICTYEILKDMFTGLHHLVQAKLCMVFIRVRRNKTNYEICNEGHKNKKINMYPSCLNGKKMI